MPVLLTITNGGAPPAGASSGRGNFNAANPHPGTPAFAIFSDFVDFSPVAYSRRTVSGNSVTAQVFSGLDSTKEYSFRGTMNGARDSQTFQWTLIEIVGAESFSSHHSAGCFTMADVPGLTPSQVLINLAANNTITKGDVVAWGNIHAGADGSFAVFQSQYYGIIPGGTSDTLGGVHVFGAVRLEEILPPTSPIIVSSPRSRAVPAGGTGSFAVAASGVGPLGFQWRRNGVDIPEATNMSLILTNVGSADSGMYSVSITNAHGSETSGPAFLTVYSEVRLPLLALEDVWMYDQSGIDLGTDWRHDFDNAEWRSGPGVFAFGNSFSGTTLSRTNSEGADVTTYYFRTHFNLPTNPEGVTLVFTNIIDDGAIIYLNGQEIIRWNMPDGKIDATTSSSSVFAVHNKPTATFVSTAALRAGLNTLAAEVHQNRGDFSKDLTFGLSLTAVVGLPEPLTLGSSPSDRTVNEHELTAFVAAFDGTQPRFQWFFNGRPLPGAEEQYLVFEKTRSVDAGSYFVVASNSLNVVTSQVALLMVVPDSTAPLLISATRSFLPDQVTLSFSESLDSLTALNLSNYVISAAAAGEGLAIVGAYLLNESNVVLTVTGASIGAEYVVSVSGVRDTASIANSIATGTFLALTNRLPLIAIDGLWRFYSAGTDPGTEWTHAGYDDSSWQLSPALFGSSNLTQFPFPPPVFAGLPLTLVPSTDSNGSLIPTHYFRKHFNYIGATNGAVLTLRHLLADGAVYYLNGTEIFRIGVPEGPLSYTNWASRVAAFLRYEGPFSLPVTNLLSGDNLLAVEVHHANGPSYILFGCEVSALVPSLFEDMQPLHLVIGKTNNNVEVRWGRDDVWLQASQAPSGPWSTLTNSSPYTTGTFSNTRSFFRLRR